MRAESSDMRRDTLLFDMSFIRARIDDRDQETYVVERRNENMMTCMT